ncbi:sigma E regulatory protein, MucB/RseB [Collimonas sp. OK607]|uniref:DUF1329 domain-containing protein n=1 Tax=Collimonas sp. OK607 TaxID=1798194 RepID=UPI0008DEE5EC|nr:DUF1329 domain-containing protein [Collimonas sp. OK607]SFA82565.1 sigma E regulatory protein, MucB/RseB [Collimonas sp. OK607]
MKKIISWTPVAVAAVTLLFAAEASAKVATADADKLGKELTCIGAEKAGNKDGTIPEYTGKWLGTPPGVSYKPNVGEHPVDPYANEKPLFTITAENMAKYAANLSDGQKAMFAKYPKTYRMPVYPGHRDFRYDDQVCQIAEKNARDAELTDNGMGIKALAGAIPFPIPKNGDEALMNLTYPHRAWTEEITREIGNVKPDGSISWGRANNLSLNMTGDPSLMGKPYGPVQAYNRSLTLFPERDKGSVSVTAEPVDFAKGKRLAWSYDPGTRRVRQLPEFGFDQPLGGTSGKMTIDQDRLFNGSPERYTFKLLGKRELYIPADTYRLNGGQVKYADLLKPGHINPDYARYELRRVWILEATLKDGYRHVYGKRVLALDEDNWQAVMSDYYDTRGKLWQYAEIHQYYAFDMKAWEAGSSFYYDLNSGGYIAYNMTQQMKDGPILNRAGITPAMFTPDAARAIGN